MTEPLITPAMKVAELLETWPALEQVLVAQAPAFERLRNPILRRTVARVATLEQAAGIAGLSARDLVATLRRAAGQPVDDMDVRDRQGHAGCARLQVDRDADTPPDWLDPARVRRVIDADALLAEGAVPLTVVFLAVRELGPEDILEVTVSFRPIPLVESLQKQRYRCHLAASAPDRYDLYVAGPA